MGLDAIAVRGVANGREMWVQHCYYRLFHGTVSLCSRPLNQILSDRTAHMQHFHHLVHLFDRLISNLDRRYGTALAAHTLMIDRSIDLSPSRLYCRAENNLSDLWAGRKRSLLSLFYPNSCGV